MRGAVVTSGVGNAVAVVRIRVQPRADPQIEPRNEGQLPAAFTKKTKNSKR
jgi:hypothetical protein